MMRKIVVAGVLLALATPGLATAQQTYQQLYNQLVPPPVGAQQGGGISPYGQYNQPRQYAAPAPPVYYAPPSPPVYYQPPAQGYGQISSETGLPRTNYVNGYYRADGTYVQPYYRSR